MRKPEIEPITIEKLAGKYGLPHLDNDVALVGSLRMLPDLAEARRLSLCLFIGVCTDGVVTLTVNDRKRAASSNNVMLISEQSVVNGLRFSDDFDGIGFFISYKLLHDVLSEVNNMSNLFLLSHNHPVFDISSDEVKTAKGYFNAILQRLSQKEHHYRKQVVRLMILTLIFDFLDTVEHVLGENQKKSQRQTKAEQVFVEFIQLVENNFREQRKVQWYAEQMGLSPKYLCEIISSVSRRSPNEWIDKFVTTEIRNLLRHTTRSMSELAKELNFASLSFFGKYFKENVGISPTDYRNGIEKI